MSGRFAFETLLELGRGGMGSVSLVRIEGAAGFERLSVVKRMFSHMQTDNEAVGRFLNEARLVSRVHHTNVLGVQRVGRDDAGYFLLLDYIEGDSLDGLVQRLGALGQRLSLRVLARVLLDGLSGLHAVHELRDDKGRPWGVLHRDVSPQNLLVGRDGVTRLADFGIARDPTRSVATSQNCVVGKTLYMPPEYLRRRPVDRRFDVYGMGVTAWIGLTGRRPWEGLEPVQIWARAMRDGLPALGSAAVAASPALETFVARAVAREPDARFASARAMADALEQLAASEGGLASHDEVGALVEELCGQELAARRQRVAAASKAARSRAAGVKQAASEPFASLEGGEGSFASDTPPTRRAPVVAPVARAVLLALGVAAAGITALAFSLERLTVTPQKGDAVVRLGAQAGPAPAPLASPSGEAAPASSTVAAAVVAPPDDPPPAQAPLARSAPSSRAALPGRPAPIASVLTPAPPRASAPAGQPNTPAERVPPSVISKVNPYR